MLTPTEKLRLKKDPMAKTRKINQSLTRVLDQSDSIVYLVSKDSELAYANEACATWVGLDLETLVGTELVYTSETLEDSKRDAVKGLAIAPHLIAATPDQQASFSWKIFASRGGQQDLRVAQAMPLVEEQSLLGYLVVTKSFDEAATMPTAHESIDSPTRQHEALMLVRQEMQKRFDAKRLVGTSAAATRVRRQILSATASQSDVLLVGPEGSGREHLARTLFLDATQDASPADDKAMIPIHGSITDPAQIQQTMKELLNRKSDRSTLLLIDVDKMDGASQQELLGYLRLPGLTTRIITTASRELIGCERFDAALAQRLCTLVIQLVPLSDRREDVPMIAQAILESKNDQTSRQFSGFSRQANEMICEYDWPGNFGQLADAIDEAAHNANGPIIEVDDFSTDFHHAIKAQRFAQVAETKIQLDTYLIDIESQLVQRAIAQAKGNKTKAAELLGISRGKLLRRLAMFEQAASEKGDPQLASDDGELLDPSVFKESDDDQTSDS